MPTVVRIALPVPLYRAFDYAAPEAAPAVGCRVAVRFAHRELVGVCVEIDPEDPHDAPKPIERVIDPTPLLSPFTIRAARWLAEYYHYPLGEVLSAMLPAEARRGGPARLDPPMGWQVDPEVAENLAADLQDNNGQAYGLSRAAKQRQLLSLLLDTGALAAKDIAEKGFSRAVLQATAERGLLQEVALVAARRTEAGPTLTAEQQAAVDAIDAADGFRTFLLDGITGSGKTEVYLSAMERTVASGRQALLLVPEISLTPQTVRRVRNRFQAVEVLHSAMTDKERWQSWLRCSSGESQVLIGTRSAVFAQFADLGLVIVDEEHDPSFKQQDGLRYSARDFAVMRAQMEGHRVILGSATPSLESLHNAQAGRYEHLLLRSRAGGASLPEIKLMDIRGHDLVEGISPQLLHVIRTQLESGGQVLIFLNRRGFAPTLMCSECGWIAQCRDCDARMTYHSNPDHLRCHHCGWRSPMTTACQDCASRALIAVGQGTQRAEQGLAQTFPDTPIIRIDRDSTRTQSQLEAHLTRVRSGEPMILIGTQMLAKGHDFPNVTLVAVINADGGFFSADFRAPERTAQTIVQVAGRAGRAHKPGTVWIQTHQPQHPLLTQLVGEGYASFAAQELDVRQAAQMPPFQPTAMIRADGLQPAAAEQFLRSLRPQLAPAEALGPAPAPIQRISNRFRFQLLVTSSNRRTLHGALRQVRDIAPPRDLRWSIDVDPYDSF